MDMTGNQLAFQNSEIIPENGDNDSVMASAMPDDSMLDEETKNFLAQGYIMGSDCFGRGAKQYADQLMEFIHDEYSDFLYYLQLSKKAM